jgi:hypothetical protein
MDQRHFPSEVDRVLHAGVHALAARGAVDMCGIAGEEDSTRSIVGHLALVDSKSRQPNGVGCGDAAGPSFVENGLHFFQRWVRTRPRRFRVSDIGDDAVPPGRDGKYPKHPVRMPIQAQFVRLGGEAGEVNVREDPVARLGVAFELQVQAMTYRAVGAVAADQPLDV